MRLEQQRLFNWSSEIGLLDYLDGSDNGTAHNLLGLSRNSILDTLLQIQSIAVDFIRTKNKYKSLVPDEDNHDNANIDNGMKGCTGNWDSDHFPNISRILKRPRAFMSPLIQELPKRLKWAACEKEKYTNLITRFRELNDALIDLADGDARVAIREATRETNTTVLHLHSRIEELVELTKALTPDSSPTSLTSTLFSNASSHFTDTEPMRQLADLAVFKTMNTSVENNTITEYDNSLKRVPQKADLKLARPDFCLFPVCDNGTDRCEASYQPVGLPQQRVWIEWRAYDPVSMNQPDLGLSRVEKLVMLLCNPRKPDFLRVPHCLGYFDDVRGKENNYRRGRLGFVFQKPTTPTASPVSLRQSIKTRSKPLLTERVALAKAISNCINSLHSVNWLHKAIRSDNIIFFPEDVSYINYRCPFLSGFGYARPTFREDMTELPSQNPEHDMYRHPLTHGLGPWEGRQGFKRTFDIYSLGIVLVEIANWETIDEVLGLPDPATLDDAILRNIRHDLLDRKIHLKKVGSEAGVRFRDAARSCIDSTTALDVALLEDETDAHVAARISQNFYHRVLKPLEEIQT